MSARPLVVIDHDRARGVALVTGSEQAYRACVMTALEGREPRWSHRGRGYVVTAAAVPDLRAFAQVHRLLVVERERPP